MGEVDLHLAVLGDRDARGGELGLAGDEGGENRVELDVLDGERLAELLGDGLADLDVDADDLLALAELVGREGGLGDHADGAGGGGDGLGGSGLVREGEGRDGGRERGQREGVLHVWFLGVLGWFRNGRRIF